MSRSDHTLRSEAWWGKWAPMFRRDNRELAQRTRKNRMKDIARIDARQLDEELEASACDCCEKDCETCAGTTASLVIR